MVSVEGPQKGDMRHTCADTQRARAELGFCPSVDLEHGLAAEHAWLKQMLDVKS
jgi:nucleoside-diphosphate-sugar epimerase